MPEKLYASTDYSVVDLQEVCKDTPKDKLSH